MNPEAVLFCDGGARGNPGPAAAGYVLRKWSKSGPGEVIRSDGVYLGIATNNEAEYMALILGLRAAVEEGMRRVEIRLDSELIVRQINGEYRVKNPRLKPLYMQAKEVLDTLDHWSVVHVGRKLNRDADSLVNATLDAAGAQSIVDCETRH